MGTHYVRYRVNKGDYRQLQFLLEKPVLRKTGNNFVAQLRKPIISSEVGMATKSFCIMHS